MSDATETATAPEIPPSEPALATAPSAPVADDFEAALLEYDAAHPAKPSEPAPDHDAAPLPEPSTGWRDFEPKGENT